MKKELLEKVKLTLAEILNINSLNEIKDNSKLKDDLGLDSMSSLTFLMALEDKITGFVVDPDNLEMEDLETVISITEYVYRQICQPVSEQSYPNQMKDAVGYV